MLNQALMSQLETIQANVSIDETGYQLSYENMPCGNGPTNCQNQW